MALVHLVVDNVERRGFKRANYRVSTVSRNLTVPDNIPIIAMMILVMFFTYIALKQARRNDQLIEHGHRERIIDEMRK